MIIERQLAAYVVYSEDPVLRALEKITANKSRLIFCVDASGHLDAALSDGDFRRWVSSTTDLDVQTPVLEVANRDVRSLPVSTPPAQIEQHFAPGIDLIPLVDERHHLVAVAINRRDELRVGRHVVDEDSPALLISEIGINHNGSVDLAKQLVDLSAEAGADVVKFQLRDMAALYRQSSGSSAGEDLGPQYTLDLLSRFNLTADQLFEVFDHCRDVGIEVDVHGLGPAQRRPARGVRRPRAQGRLRRPDQPRAADAHGPHRHPDGRVDRACRPRARSASRWS